ncbi:hypothetical protein PoB_001182300 [Plakobranchus ocellatus]|uniref:Uncharacterized protein n=1 Tax=Plakobranchus ocellatus TaxID=259542 RepID=A0AAV3YSH4_9GAST|nr:hypothetical protein PoB_001182300 [Plakobranchus ocellatus]
MSKHHSWYAHIRDSETANQSIAFRHGWLAARRSRFADRWMSKRDQIESSNLFEYQSISITRFLMRSSGLVFRCTVDEYRNSNFILTYIARLVIPLRGKGRKIGEGGSVERRENCFTRQMKKTP